MRSISTLNSLRPPFSSAQLLQANHVGRITDIHREGRPLLPTHPIDEADPHIASDRDDGIFVETIRHDDGSYKAYITIADVAGHVGLKTPLARSAVERGFTVYGPGWTDPMFPKPLEEKLSLEHQQERLGFSIIIELDSNFRPRHTEFRPIVTKAESLSYSQASELMKSDPQLQQMAQIASGIRTHFFGKQGNRLLLQDSFLGRDLFHTSPDSWGSATEMVATYMLLTNSCVAEFFHKSGLPYVYRNFNSQEDNARARYQTHHDGHDALEHSMGLHGPYGHFTSPIRRAADFLNAHMAHFAFKTLQLVEESTTYRYPDIDRPQLHHLLWQNGPELLKACANPPDSDQRPDPQIRKAKEIIVDILGKALPANGSAISPFAVSTIVQTLTQQTAPLTSERLDQYTTHLNNLAHAPEMRILTKQVENYEKLNTLNDTVFSNYDKKAFSALLKQAATVNNLPANLYLETLKRLKENNADLVQDGFSILILASHPDAPQWNILKRALLSQIKHNPGMVNGIVERTRSHFGEERFQEQSIVLPDSTADDRHHVHASILALKQDERAPLIAAPFYSIGHNARAAYSHARYAFLEHFAFGELQPIEQTAIPNVLYAELESEGKSRRLLVENMVQQAKGRLNIDVKKVENGATAHLEIKDGDFVTPIVIDAKGATAEIAEHTAFRRLLRDPGFKHAVAPVPQVAALLYPQQVLESVVREQNLQVTFSEPVSLASGGFSAEITIASDQASHTFKGVGPNKDRASRTATVLALKGLGKSISEDNSLGPHIQSWATDSDYEQSRKSARTFMPHRPRWAMGGTYGGSTINLAVDPP